MITVLVTGGFDPIHAGHVEYFKHAAKLGQSLVVGLNSDEWLARKKGQPFIPFNERKAVIENLRLVDRVISFNDADNTACDALQQLLVSSDKYVMFANGGDRTNTTTPEYERFKNHPRVLFMWGVGGEDKKNSSSWLLDKWKYNKTERDWGYWRVLDDKQPRIAQKVKELVINPGANLSNQKHMCRSEHWYVLEGDVQIDLELPDGSKQTHTLIPHTSFVIQPNTWHKATNIGNVVAHIVETQYGEKCVEDDIERK